MTTALVNRDVTAVAAEWNAEEVRLVKEMLTDNLTDPEFKLFAQICMRTGLSPFTRQIYAIKRNQKQHVDGQWVNKSVMTIQTGIDGYRVIAERTGEYVGGDAPVYGPACGCKLSAQTPHPEWAEVTVRRLKNGVPYTTSERADFDEYVQTFTKNGGTSIGTMWAKMPKRMIAKCAEALALRRAFPGLFEGVYTTEEMSQADNEPIASRAPSQPPTTPAATVVETTAREVPTEPQQTQNEIILAGECPVCRGAGWTTKSGKPVKWLDKDGARYCNGYDPNTNTWPKHVAEIPF
jgi:phage recombination protein Bet